MSDETATDFRERLAAGIGVGLFVFYFFLIFDVLFAALAVTTVSGPWWWKYQIAAVLAGCFGAVAGLFAATHIDG